MVNLQIKYRQDAAVSVDPDPTILVSIIVCFYNNVSLTARCLETLRINTPEHAYELILVDDGSDDPVAAQFEDWSWITFVRSAQNRGLARAANLGAWHTTGTVPPLSEQ